MCMAKRLLFKATGIIPPKAGNYMQGIGRSNVEILKQLIKINDPDIELHMYCNSDIRLSYNYEEWKEEIKTHKYFLPHHLGLFSNIEPLWRKYVVKYDLLHITGNFDRVDKNENFVLTIHDLARYKLSPWWQKVFRQSAERARGIITDAEYTKKEVASFFKIDESKITAIHLGISQDVFYPRSKDCIFSLCQKFNIPQKYFFSCSCAHPRKNAKDILSAFELFAKENKDAGLVLAWSNPPIELFSKYKPLIEEGRIIFLDYVNDDDLATLYSGALASFLVSSLEGFGFPILESMACGTNCITCKNTSMTELGADKACWVEEHNIEDIANAMLHFSENGKGDVNILINYAKTYSWENTARRYIDFYKKNM